MDKGGFEIILALLAVVVLVVITGRRVFSLVTGIDSISQEPNAGLTILGFLIVAALYAGILNLAMFAVEAWRGTLDPADLGRFILKAAFGLLLIRYFLPKIKASLRTR